jgi:pyruvate kinase
MQKFTKITSSIGPNSENKEVLLKMIEQGVDVCRLNFSHDTGEAQGAKIDLIREISKKVGRPIAVLVDLQGPKHRIGNFETEDHYPLKVGQIFVLDNDSTPGNSHRVQLPDTDVLNSLKVGERILLNDGKIELKVEKVSENNIETIARYRSRNICFNTKR